MYSLQTIYDKWNKDLQFNEANTKWKKYFHLTSSILDENLWLMTDMFHKR